MKKIILFVSFLFLYSDADNISLVDACKIGIKNESSLKSYELQVKSLSEDVFQAKARFLPQVDASATYLDRKALVNYKNEYEQEEVKSYSLNLKQAIYYPDSYASLDKAKSRELSEQYGLEYYKQEMFEKISVAYINVLKSQNRIRLSKNYIDSMESNFVQIERMYNLELADKMKYLKAKVDFENAKLSYQNELNQFEVALATFRLLINSTYTPIDIDSNAKIDIDVENFSTVDDNLKIKKMNEYTKALQSDVRHAAYQHYPKIDMIASYTKFSPDNKDVTDYLNDRSFKVELRLPIFSGGAMISNQRKAELLYAASKHDLDSAMQEEKIALDDALAKYNYSKSNIQLFNNAIESAELFLYSIMQGYEKGLKSIAELEDAKSKLEEMRYKRKDNYYEYILSSIKILKYSGNLNEENLNKFIF